jgi:uncharacterized hydantoinase/oxoprolinase family protein
LIGRVVCKKQRPLTEAEIKHKQRQVVLERINTEIKSIQKHTQYERAVVKGLKEFTEARAVSGPMKNAAIEYAKRFPKKA